MAVIKLTRTHIRGLPPGEHRDAELKGFLLLVGAPSTKNPRAGRTRGYSITGIPRGYTAA